MNTLTERILREGRCLPGGILKVDGFINHQIDPSLMKAAAEEILRRYAGERITKVLTIEASGIAPAILTGLLLDCPVVFAKKKKPSTMGEAFSTQVFSFTKQTTSDVSVARQFLSPADRVLFVDDFLAHGNAAKAIVEIVRQSGATLVGTAFLIEKTFQSGSGVLQDLGVRVESLVRIASLDDCVITLAE